MSCYDDEDGTSGRFVFSLVGMFLLCVTCFSYGFYEANEDLQKKNCEAEWDLPACHTKKLQKSVIEEEYQRKLKEVNK
jgi:hypothetical protein